MMENYWVKICHPELSDNEPVLVTAEAFDNLYSGKGWVLDESVDLPGEVVETSPRGFAKPKKATKPKSK